MAEITASLKRIQVENCAVSDAKKHWLKLNGDIEKSDRTASRKRYTKS